MPVLQSGRAGRGRLPPFRTGKNQHKKSLESDFFGWSLKLGSHGKPWEAMGSHGNPQDADLSTQDSVIADPGNADVGKAAAGLLGCRWSRERGNGDDTSTRPKKNGLTKKGGNNRWKHHLETSGGSFRILERSLVQYG